ncbi:MAG: zinc ribbon domain-containing protein [Rikenellaceae bacterium]|nr:zinc ribbon domain-containing protein [Rikenellaceae bacterium]
MGTFNTKQLIDCSPTLIPQMADSIKSEFQKEGYDVERTKLSNGGYDISISKGGVFKAIVGLRTALKITLLPQGSNHIDFEAGIGIWGQQVVPTLVMWFVTWPVMLTQLWGMVKQSQLDDKALAIVLAVRNKANSATLNAAPATTLIAPPTSSHKFCIACGHKNEAEARFCCACGNKL